jgi:hypothetical protein
MVTDHGATMFADRSPGARPMTKRISLHGNATAGTIVPPVAAENRVLRDFFRMFGDHVPVSTRANSAKMLVDRVPPSMVVGADAALEGVRSRQ